MRKLLHKLRYLLGRSRRDDELAEELRFHRSMAEREGLDAGLTPEEARRRARRQLGNETLAREDARSIWAFPMIDDLIQDLRYGVRMLARNGRSASLMIVALAVGIGATTATFCAVDRLLFRSLPYPDDDRLVSAGITGPIAQDEFMMSGAYFQWKQEQAPFESMTSWSGIADCDLTELDPAQLGCARVEWDFLPTLGILPLIGRNFSADEDRPTAAKVVLLSFGLWRSRFGGDPNIVDKTISLDGGVARVIGVLPATFELPTLHQFDLVVPQALPETSRSPSATRLLRVFARLKPDVNVEQATAQLQTQFVPYLETVPVGLRKDAKLSVRSLRDRQVGSARTASILLLGSGAIVLLIACANVANLLLGLAARRREEMEIRAALGAGRWRLIRQTCAESLVLGLSGGLAGCGLAYLFLRLIVSVAPSGLPRLAEAELDLRVLVFAFAISLFSVFLFGVIPGLRSRVSGSLAGSRSVGPHRGVFRQSLVVGQIAASLVLLTLAGLLLRSLWSLENQPLGMDVEDVFVSQITLNHRDYAEPARSQAFFEGLEDGLRALPGVTIVAVSDSLPPSGRMRARPYARISVLGQPAPEEDTPGVAGWRSVTPGYFLALGIPILQGRAFQEQDRNPSSEGTIIVSEALAGVMFPDGEPVGRRVRVSPEGPWLEVVGIAQDVRNAGLAAPAEPEYYVVRQHASDYGLGPQITADDKRRASVIVRSPLGQVATANQIRAEVARLDPTTPVAVDTLKERVGRLSARPRFTTTVLLLFAGVAITLAAIGIYGVIWFLTSERTREIGVRIALGANTSQVTRSVIWQAARWTFTGTVVGLGASFATREAAESLFFGVPQTDWLVTAIAVLLVLLAAFSAAWIPARRAGRIDAMTALRLE